MTCCQCTLQDAIILILFIFSIISEMFQSVVDHLQVNMKLLYTKVLLTYMF